MDATERLAALRSNDDSLAVVAAHADPETFADVKDQVAPAAPVVVIVPDWNLVTQALFGLQPVGVFPA